MAILPDSVLSGKDATQKHSPVRTTNRVRTHCLRKHNSLGSKFVKMRGEYRITGAVNGALVFRLLPKSQGLPSLLISENNQQIRRCRRIFIRG